MKIKRKTLMVQIEHELKLGHNNAIEVTLLNQAFIFKSKINDTIQIEIEQMDVFDVKFMGIPIEEGHTSYNKFKETLKTLGINLDLLIDEACEGLYSEDDYEQLESLYKF